MRVVALWERARQVGVATAPVHVLTEPDRTMRLAIMTTVDANFTDMLGWPADEAVGLRSTEFIHPEDRERAIASWMELLAGGASQRIRLRHRSGARAQKGSSTRMPSKRRKSRSRV